MSFQQFKSKKKEKNEELPNFIRKNPWYNIKNEIQHVEVQNSINQQTHKGIISEPVTKFRKGACANCGSMTHNVKTCTERPRKIGAKYKPVNLGKDEFLQEAKLNYEGKRDRWNGFTGDMYSQYLTEWGQLEKVRKKQKRQGDSLGLKQQEVEDSSEDDEVKSRPAELEFYEAKIDPRTKTTTRNLRIREDTAVYLKDLNPDSAIEYDGKSRAIQSNQLKYSEEMKIMREQERFAFQMTQNGNDLNPVSDPSQTELAYKFFKGKKQKIVENKNQHLIEKYGSQDNYKMKPEIIGIQEDS